MGHARVNSLDLVGVCMTRVWVSESRASGVLGGGQSVAVFIISHTVLANRMPFAHVVPDGADKVNTLAELLVVNKEGEVLMAFCT